MRITGHRRGGRETGFLRRDRRSTGGRGAQDRRRGDRSAREQETANRRKQNRGQETEDKINRRQGTRVRKERRIRAQNMISTRRKKLQEKNSTQEARDRRTGS